MIMTYLNVYDIMQKFHAVPEFKVKVVNNRLKFFTIYSLKGLITMSDINPLFINDWIYLFRKYGKIRRTGNFEYFMKQIERFLRLIYRFSPDNIVLSSYYKYS